MCIRAVAVIDRFQWKEGYVGQRHFLLEEASRDLQLSDLTFKPFQS
jgi:hypothetical protein